MEDARCRGSRPSSLERRRLGRERNPAPRTPMQVLEFTHFACTSEDINNLAHALMFKEAMEQEVLPALDAVIDAISRCVGGLGRGVGGLGPPGAAVRAVESVATVQCSDAEPAAHGADRILKYTLTGRMALWRESES